MTNKFKLWEHPKDTNIVFNTWFTVGLVVAFMTHFQEVINTIDSTIIFLVSVLLMALALVGNFILMILEKRESIL